MSIALVPLTPPAAEPVTLAEAKAHLRVEDTAEDSYITALIATARVAAESFTARAFLTQSWRLQRDAWPSDPCRPWIDLPRPPVLGVTEVRVRSADGDATVWDSALYSVDLAAAPGRLYRRPGVLWPLLGRSLAGIEIDYDAGYGAAASDVPAPIRHAILMQVAYLFEHRDPGPLSADVCALLAPFRLVSL